MASVSKEIEDHQSLATKYGIKCPSNSDEDLETLKCVINSKILEHVNWKKDWGKEQTLIRFLRAFITIDGAIDALVAYFNWRVKYDVDNITEHHSDVKKEDSVGRLQIVKDQMDSCGRPICIGFVRQHDKGHGNYESLFTYMIFQLEYLCKLCDDSELKNFCIVFDLNGFSMQNMDYRFIQDGLHILKNYYPERLGVALVVNYPWIFYGCWKIIKYMMNDVTRSKILFAGEEEFNDFVDHDALPVTLF